MTEALTPEVVQVLVERHRRFLQFLEPRVGSRAVAEELLQAAFVKAVERGSELRDGESAVAWFYRLLRNALVDFYRHRDAERRAMERHASETQVTTERDFALDAAICECVHGLIPTLKAEYADILRAVEMEGQGLADVAQRLAITESVLRLAASLERGSEHPLASAILLGAAERGVKVSTVEDFRSETGKGIVGRVEGHAVALGKRGSDDDDLVAESHHGPLRLEPRRARELRGVERREPSAIGEGASNAFGGIAEVPLTTAAYWSIVSPPFERPNVRQRRNLDPGHGQESEALMNVIGMLSLLLVVGIGASAPAGAQTLVQANVDTRTVVNLKVSEAEIQKLLPAPWQINPVASGPAQGANLILVFIDRLVNHDGQGKPAAGGMDRALAVVIPAKNPQTGAAGPNVVRVYTPNPQGIPGPYKNSAQVSMLLEQSMKATDVEPASVSERWELRDAAGGMVTLQLEYPRALPARAKAETKIYGGPDPNFFRIYKVDQGADLLKSVPATVDRVKKYQLRVTMADLRKAFDGNEQVVGIATLPWYVREVSLP